MKCWTAINYMSQINIFKIILYLTFLMPEMSHLGHSFSSVFFLHNSSGIVTLNGQIVMAELRSQISFQSHYSSWKLTLLKWVRN